MNNVSDENIKKVLQYIEEISKISYEEAKNGVDLKFAAINDLAYKCKKVLNRDLY